LESEETIKRIQQIIPNFRDLAEFNQTYIKPGMIFRSSSPISFQSPELLHCMIGLGLKSIVDLRSAVEIGYASYNDDFLNYFNYYWVHIDISMPTEVLVKEGVNTLSFYKQFCWYTLFYNKNQVRRIFNILSRPENYSVVLHCHAGRDRTGIIASLILLMLNAPEPNIIQDYLATDAFTQSDDMEFVFQQIEEVGGIMKYLTSCGLQKNTIEDLIERLKPE
jgi:protein tyrosine/serine phosphatase